MGRGLIACAFSLAACNGVLGIDYAQEATVPSAPQNVAVATTVAVTTFAGRDSVYPPPTPSNGPANMATFFDANGVAVDAAGNVYVADTGDNVIRKITPAGVVTTLAGTGAQGNANGAGSTASFYSPAGVVVDSAGNVYVADGYNYLVRKVSPGGDVTTLASTGAAPNQPVGIALGAAGNIYVADSGNDVLEVTPAGVVRTVASGFSDTQGVAVGSAGDVYVADMVENRISRVTPAGAVIAFAGTGGQGSANGPANAATFFGPTGVAVDRAGNVYVADSGNYLIREVTTAGEVTTLAGTGVQGSANGAAAAASFRTAEGIAVDSAGDVYVADAHLIRKIAAVAPGQVMVTWNAPSLDGGLTITRYTASASSSGQPTQSCTTDNFDFCAISGLMSGVTYSVAVTASNAAGESPPSGAVTAVPH